MLGLLFDLLQSVFWLVIIAALFMVYAATALLRLAMPPLVRWMTCSLRRKNSPTGVAQGMIMPPRDRPFPPAPTPPQAPVPELPKYRPYRH